MRISDWSSDVCSSDLSSELMRVAPITRSSARPNIPRPVGEGGSTQDIGTFRSVEWPKDNINLTPDRVDPESCGHGRRLKTCGYLVNRHIIFQKTLLHVNVL